VKRLPIEKAITSPIDRLALLATAIGVPARCHGKGTCKIELFAAGIERQVIVKEPEVLEAALL